MPTYTYECKRCFRVRDVFHAMNASPRVKCTECGGPCKRLLGTGAGLIFKGDGFYETDYKRKGGSASDKVASEGKAEPTGDGKGESRSEAEGEGKSESTAPKAADD